MSKKRLWFGALALAALAVCPFESSQVYAQRRRTPPPQYQNPYNLSIIAPTQRAGSDARSADFQSRVMPAFMHFIDENLQECTVFDYAPDFVLDPTMLYLPLPTNQPVRVYFLWEGAGYRNQLGVNITDAGHGRDGQSAYINPVTQGKLIFPDASFDNPPNGPDSQLPLNIGDFVEIGNISSGKTLDFFLVSNGANGSTDVLSNFIRFNSDGLQHVITAYFRQDFPGFILIGFEDIVGGGDLDYNDCLFVVDIGYDVAVTQNDLPN